METETRDPEIMAEMHRRLNAGCDPLTGDPFDTCYPHSVEIGDKGEPECVGCGGVVVVDERGNWRHGRLIFNSLHADTVALAREIVTDAGMEAEIMQGAVYLIGDRSDETATEAGNRLMDAGLSSGICW